MTPRLRWRGLSNSPSVPLDTIRDFKRTQDVIDLRSFADLDSWADVRGHLSLAGANVALRMTGHILRIEDTSLASLAADDFLW